MKFLLSPQLFVFSFALLCVAGTGKIAVATDVNIMDAELALPFSAPTAPLGTDRAGPGALTRPATQETGNPAQVKAEDVVLEINPTTKKTPSPRLPVGRLSWREVTNWQELRRAFMRK